MALEEKRCLPCEGISAKLKAADIQNHLAELNPNWILVDEKIKREFRFVNFIQTMEFVNKVAEIAEEEEHHPEMLVGYGKCDVWLWTHAINGLSINDFILATKINLL